MRAKNLIMLSLLVFSQLACASSSKKLPTVSKVNVNEYVGKWYAVTSFPQFFTRKCVAQTAEYGIIDSKTISVHNVCIKKDGSTNDIRGKAVVANEQTNAELIVTFDTFWTKLFRVKGDYNILKLDDSYSTVLIGSNDLKSLWIMSRTPYIAEDTKKEYVEAAKKLGFDTSKLEDSKF